MGNATQLVQTKKESGHLAKEIPKGSNRVTGIKKRIHRVDDFQVGKRIRGTWHSWETLVCYRVPFGPFRPRVESKSEDEFTVGEGMFQTWV